MSSEYSEKSTGGFLSTGNQAILWMVLGGFAFSTMAALTHDLGDECDWLLIVFVRMLISFIIAFGLAKRAGLNPILLGKPLLWVRSLVGSSAMLATFYAIVNLPISDVAVITETRPIWVAILAGYLLGEYTGKRIWLSIVFGMAGVVLVEHPRLVEQNFAGLLALYAAFAGSVVMICLRKLRDIDFRVIVTHFSGTATLVSLLVLLFWRHDHNPFVFGNSMVVVKLLGVGVFGTIGQFAMTKAFSIGEAPSVASAGFIKVAFASGYDLMLWNHVFQIPTLIGMALIILSTGWLVGVRRAEVGEEPEEETAEKVPRLVSEED